MTYKIMKSLGMANVLSKIINEYVYFYELEDEDCDCDYCNYS